MPLVKKWIKDTIDFDIDEGDMRLGSDFLMIWSIFEESYSETGFGLQLIRNDKTQKELTLVEDSIPSLNNLFVYFYDRYQDQSKLRDLKGKVKHNSTFIEEILKKDKSLITIEEKVTLLLYVVFRYRNNMFHGSKALKDWASIYKIQINKCIDALMLLYGNLKFV